MRYHPNPSDPGVSLKRSKHLRKLYPGHDDFRLTSFAVHDVSDLQVADDLLPRLVAALKKGRALARRESLSRASGELGEPYLKALVKEMDVVIAEAQKHW